MDSIGSLVDSSVDLFNSPESLVNSSESLVNSSSWFGNTSSEVEDARNLSLHGKNQATYTIIGTLVISLNIVGIILFCKSKTIFKNLQVYIVSLMVCDLLTGFSFLLSPLAFQLSESRVVLEQTSSIVRTMLLLSLLHTAGLSIDRFISVRLPNVYNIRVTSRISTLVCLCIWTVMITYHILLIFFSTNAPMSGQFDMKSYVVFISVYIVCLLIYLTSSKSIISCARDHLKRIKANAPLQEQQKSNTFRLSIVVTTASGFLYILYLPAEIYVTLTFFDPFGEMKVTRFFMAIAYPLLTIESLLNPLLYVLRFKETRQMIKRVFCQSITLFEGNTGSNTSSTTGTHKESKECSSDTTERKPEQ